MIVKMYGQLLCKKNQKVLIDWENGDRKWLSFQSIPDEMIKFIDGQYFTSTVDVKKNGSCKILTCVKEEQPKTISLEKMNLLRKIHTSIIRKAGQWD